MSRLAKCSCGALQVSAEGEPQAVVACHCIECQRRTGSAFGVGAYYLKEEVQISGESRTFVRPTDAGYAFTTNFCPNCGSSVFWASGKNPGLIGVAVGAFADPSFPAPVRSVWEQSMHPWAAVSVASGHFEKGRVS